MTRRIIPLTAVVIAMVTLACGCSDDIICPELVDTLPYVSALVVQSSDGRDESTHVEVVCTADPVLSGFSASINALSLSVVVRPDGLGYLATLDADAVLWPPETPCLLIVTMDHDQAAATIFVPHATAVTEPAEISLGDSLRLTWRSVTDADYYEVSAVFVPDAGAPMRAVPGNGDTLAFSDATRETFAVVPSATFSSPGVLSGFVETVTGPFPEGGTAGNISGDGWGFFTLRYRDSGSVFDVVVSDVP